MADLARLDDRQLKKELSRARKAVQRASAYKGSGRSDLALAELNAAGAEFRAAQSEQSRRKIMRLDRPWKEERMQRWAHNPAPSRRRRGGPDPYEPIKKVFWLLRSSLPYPLQTGDLDGARLTTKEGQELLDITLAALEGGVAEKDIRRWEHLLEKCADRPGAIQAARAQGYPRPQERVF